MTHQVEAKEIIEAKEQIFNKRYQLAIDTRNDKVIYCEVNKYIVEHKGIEFEYLSADSAVYKYNSL